MTRARLRAVLFDLDGTLADTEPVWMAAKATVAARHRVPWTERDALAAVGQPTPVYSAEFVRRGAAGTVDDIADEITAEVVTTLACGTVWRPGAIEALRHCAESGLRTALVTMAYRPVAVAIAHATGLPVFDVIVAGDEVEHAKPHPDPYLRALRALGVEAGEAIAVEDTLTGASSAEAAGIRTFAVPSDGPLPPAPLRQQFGSLAGLFHHPVLRNKIGRA